MSKTFLLGVGCQKGGTTWIHHQLNKHEQCDFGFARKEYHIFNKHNSPDYNSFLSKLTKKVLRELRNNKRSPSAQRLAFYCNHDLYYDYFDYLYLKSPQVKIVGDISPSYANLSQEEYREIKENLERRGFTVKVFFSMRDPIDRCLSNLSMERNQQRKSNRKRFLKMVAPDLAIKAAARSKNYKDRTTYNKTIQNLEAVFSPNNIFYTLYENLFQTSTLNQFSQFLGDASLSFEPQKIIFAGTEKMEFTAKESTLRNLFHFYSEVYEFCDKRFETREAWRGWKYND